MYDGLSKSDLRVILAHQEIMGDPTMCMRNAIKIADAFLSNYEALNIESESSDKRDDGEGEGTRGQDAG